MTFTWKLAFLLVAIVLFALAACGIGNGRMVPAGLAFFAASFLPIGG